MNTRVITKGQPDKYGKTISSARKPIKSADKHFNYDGYLGDIYDSDKSNADNWSKEEYNKMVETVRGIFYPAVQKAANDCHFTVSDNEAEYVAEKCVRCFFDNASWDEAVNRPEEYYVNSSRKPIKSAFGGTAVFEIMDDKLMNARRNIRSCISINPREELNNELQNIDELIGDALTHTEMVKNGDYDNYMSPVNNSRKLIKSSLEDRLVPYLEEFEEGYSDALVKDSQNGDDFNHVYEDTFYEMFKSDYNLTDADIQKLEKAVREIWDASSTEEGEVRDMGEMYGAPRGASPKEALKHFE